MVHLKSREKFYLLFCCSAVCTAVKNFFTVSDGRGEYNRP